MMKMIVIFKGSGDIRCQRLLYDGEHYYQISVSKDSIDGNFVVPGRTRIVDPVSLGSTVITVDTVGFPTSGSFTTNSFIKRCCNLYR